MPGPEDHREPGELELEGHGRLGGGVVVEELGQGELASGEYLGQPDRGHGEDEAGRPGEATDDEHLGEQAQQQGGGQAGGDGQPEVPLGADDQRGGHDRSQAAEVALGEVDDAVGPVYEHQAHGHQPAERAQDEPQEQDGQGRRVDHPDEDQKGQRPHSQDEAEAGVLGLQAQPPRCRRKCPAASGTVGHGRPSSLDPGRDPRLLRRAIGP